MGALVELVKQLRPVEKKRLITPQESSSAAQRLSPAERELRWAYYEPPTDFRKMMSAYMTNAWVYSAVYLIASTASSVPFQLYTRRTHHPVDVDHYLSNVFEQPNPFMTFTDMLESTFLCLELVGNSFWELVYNEYGHLKEIYFLNPCNMRILPDPEFYVQGYEYVVGSTVIRYSANEVVHFKYTNPLNEYWGMGSITPIWDQIVLDNYAKDYNARFFVNDATPSGVISTPRPLSDTAFSSLQRRWSQRHEGHKKAFKVAVLDDGMKFDSVATTPKDASFIEMRKIVRDALYVGTGVPPVLAGVPDVANYSTARVAQSLFYDSTIAPKLQKVGDTIDYRIVRPQDPALQGAFDTSVAPINIIKLSANSRIVERLMKAGLVTIDEARALLGLPPMREEDKPKKRKPSSQPSEGNVQEGDSEGDGHSGESTDGYEGGGGSAPGRPTSTKPSTTPSSTPSSDSSSSGSNNSASSSMSFIKL